MEQSGSTRITREQPRTGVTFPSEVSTRGWTSRPGSLRSRERCPSGREGVGEPKKSVSMGQIQPTRASPATTNTRSQDVNGNSDLTDGSSQNVTASPARATKEYKSEYKQKFRPFSQYEYCGDGKFFNTSVSPPTETVVDGGPRSRQATPQHLSGEPWYQEVIELRKAAADYKCRGWGTDLVPPYLSSIYSQHVDEASNRESLSPLALAITPSSLNKDEKEKENFRKSPIKPRSRPRTAPPKGSKKTSRSESARSTPGLVKDGAKTEPDGVGRPDGETRKGGVSRSASSKAQSRDVSRPPSAIENNIDYFKEPVVKSPPEPTRVRSPEQLMMRSPDPINWTVPLDTGKTFQVTQSVRENDSARNSPMSDQSSHFDSVLGTAINLGIHSVNDKGGLHYPKVSALAREAKELGGVRSKKEEKQPEGNGASQPGKTENSQPALNSVNGAVNGSSEQGVNGVERDRNDNKIQEQQQQQKPVPTSATTK